MSVFVEAKWPSEHPESSINQVVVTNGGSIFAAEATADTLREMILEFRTNIEANSFITKASNIFNGSVFNII